MKKSALVILSMIILVIVSMAFTGQNDPVYKNLKVLPKDISEAELTKIMDNFNASLGVKCGFCHVKTEDKKDWDHASDKNKHKLITREMMVMTAELNQKYFDLTGQGTDAALMVTCYTCHNGKAHPATIPPMPKEVIDTLKKN